MAALAPVAAFWRDFDLDAKWRSKLDEVRAHPLQLCCVTQLLGIGVCGVSVEGGCARLALCTRCRAAGCSLKPQHPSRTHTRAPAVTRQAGLKIAEHQEASTASRRSLADATKEWKRGVGEAGALGPV